MTLEIFAIMRMAPYDSTDCKPTICTNDPERLVSTVLLSFQQDSMYVVQVYENMGVFLDTDYSEGIKCVRSTSDVTVTVQNTFR